MLPAVSRTSIDRVLVLFRIVARSTRKVESFMHRHILQLSLKRSRLARGAEIAEAFLAVRRISNDGNFNQHVAVFSVLLHRKADGFFSRCFYPELFAPLRTTRACPGNQLLRRNVDATEITSPNPLFPGMLGDEYMNVLIKNLPHHYRDLLISVVRETSLGPAIKYHAIPRYVIVGRWRTMEN